MDISAVKAAMMDADDNDDDDDHGDEYGAALPTKPFMLHAAGDVYDLRDCDAVNDLLESVLLHRAKLNSGNLKTYEGHSTELGGGGRARLLYDSVRADLAEDYHSGRHNMNWDLQHAEAMRAVKFAAINRFKNAKA
jgi:hypothetical protein